MRFHGSNVGIFDDATTTLGLSYLGTNQIIVITLINIKCHTDAIIQETSIHTKVKLMLLLISQIPVGKIHGLDSRFLVTGERAVYIVSP